MSGETELSLYRPNVGVALFHPDGRVWLGKRANTPGPHNWQFPQGGVDPGEDLEAAARRELAEETGARSVTLLGRTDGWIAYDFPPDMPRRHQVASRPGPPLHSQATPKGGGLKRNWRGQKQVWFAFRFDGDEAEFDLAAHGPPEFEAWRWAYLEEAPALIVPFKRASYEHAARAFAPFAARRA